MCIRDRAKTTTTINLGAGLTKNGKKVVLVDADPQGHLTMGLGFPKNLKVTLKSMMENIIMGLEFDPKEGRDERCSANRNTYHQ